jgi:hypothetical protein
MQLLYQREIVENARKKSSRLVLTLLSTYSTSSRDS